jgi:hypothetical protein
MREWLLKMQSLLLKMYIYRTEDINLFINLCIELNEYKDFSYFALPYFENLSEYTAIFIKGFKDENGQRLGFYYFYNISENFIFYAKRFKLEDHNLYKMANIIRNLYTNCFYLYKLAGVNFKISNIEYNSFLDARKKSSFLKMDKSPDIQRIVMVANEKIENISEMVNFRESRNMKKIKNIPIEPIEFESFLYDFDQLKNLEPIQIEKMNIGNIKYLDDEDIAEMDLFFENYTQQGIQLDQIVDEEEIHDVIEEKNVIEEKIIVERVFVEPTIEDLAENFIQYNKEFDYLYSKNTGELRIWNTRSKQTSMVETDWESFILKHDKNIHYKIKNYKNNGKN